MVKNLVLENVSVGFKLPQGVFYAVDDVSLSLPGGNFTAIIGESGCGKSVLGQAILNILPSGVIKKGRVLYNGEQVEKILSAFGIIPQNPSESLNPVRKIGKQMQDILAVHNIADSDNSYKNSACVYSACRRTSAFWLHIRMSFPAVCCSVYCALWLSAVSLNGFWRMNLPKALMNRLAPLYAKFADNQAGFAFKYADNYA